MQIEFFFARLEFFNHKTCFGIKFRRSICFLNLVLAGVTKNFLKQPKIPHDRSQFSLARLALVDDHQMGRVGLRTLLEAVLQFEVIGEAATAAEALELLPKLAPDVVLLDMRLPDGSGLEVCRQLRRLCPQVRVLMLTSYYNDDMVMDAIQAGAEGYLLKEINAELLIRSIREVMEGKSILDPAMTRRLFDSASLQTRKPRNHRLSA